MGTLSTKCLLLIALLVGTVLGQSPSRVELRSFYSPSLATNKNYQIYLPPGYDEGSELYPVVYFLRNHEYEWFAGNYSGREGTALKEVADGLIAAGLIGKMILVAPNTGSNNGTYIGLGLNMLRPSLAPSAGIGTGRFEDYAGRDLIRMVDSTFRTIADRNHRGIDGFSYGGYSSTMLGMRHPELFGSVGSYDGAIMWHDLDDPTIPGSGPDDPSWMPSDPAQNAVFDYPRNIPYMLLHSASNILTSASPAELDSIRSIRFHISCGYDQNISNHDPNMQLLGQMLQKGIRNSIGQGVLSPTAAHDYGYADLHATSSLIKHWQTFNGTMISAPGIIDFSITEFERGNTSNVVVFNYGPDSVTVYSMSNSTSVFQLIDVPVMPVTLGPGDTMTFKVQFHPPENIAYSDTLDITSNDSSTPLAKVILRGKGGSFRAWPGTIYSASTGGAMGLYRLDSSSGTASFIGPYRRGWTSVSAIRVNPGTEELVGLAPKAGDYYRLMRVNAKGGDAFIALGFIHATDVKSIAFYNDSTLFLGSSNGTVSTVNLHDRTLYLEPTLIGNTGFSLAGIAVHPRTRELWATVGTATIGQDRIYKITLSPTLDTVRVGVTGLNRITTDIAFDARGNLYGLSGNQFIRIDTSNGQGTVIGLLGITTANSITISPDTTTLSPDTTTLTTVAFSNGWNMISCAVELPNDSFAIHFPTAITRGYAYVPGAGYQIRSRMADGVGYWLKFSGAGQVTLTGRPRDEDTIAVSPGWNMIGSISTPLPVQSITCDSGTITTSKFFGYNGSYFVTDTIYPGNGYWVKVNQSGKLILSSSSVVSSANRIRIVPTSEQPPPAPFEGEDNAMSKEIPTYYTLQQNYPNPFNPNTSIVYGIPERSRVVIEIYNVLGQIVATLVNGEQEPGYRSVEWMAANGIGSGMYFYRLTAASAIEPGRMFVQVRKMLVIK